MHLPQIFLFLITFFTTIHAFTIPTVEDVSSASQDLFKRKGGGGRGGGGGTSSGGSSSSGSSSGSSGSSSGSSGGRTGSGSTGSTGSTGSSGSSSGSRGTTSPSYGGGYYGGGAATPYRSGRTLGSGLGPALLVGAGAGVFAAYAYGAYVYNYNRPWTYYNETSNQNETHPVACACGKYDDCGCDDSNTDQDYINQVANDKNISQLAVVDGTQKLVINGTVGNETDDSTTTGSDGTTLPGAGVNLVMSSAGWVAIVGGVAYSLLL